jgi:hypothetical protein
MKDEDELSWDEIKETLPSDLPPYVLEKLQEALGDGWKVDVIKLHKDPQPADMLMGKLKDLVMACLETEESEAVFALEQHLWEQNKEDN